MIFEPPSFLFNGGFKLPWKTLSIVQVNDQISWHGIGVDILKSQICIWQNVGSSCEEIISCTKQWLTQLLETHEGKETQYDVDKSS